MFGDNVDTDVLAPGQYMKFGIEEIARHCLESVDPAFAASVRAGDVVVGGRNFGTGSSREQAPQALKHLGVAALVRRIVRRPLLPQRAQPRPARAGVRATRAASAPATRCASIPKPGASTT